MRPTRARPARARSSRSSEADYELRALDLNRNEQRGVDYLRINPMGKVPTITHNGALVTEQAAIFIYLADLYAEKNLAPPIGDPLRGPYLRWMVFYGSSFEPACIDKSANREPLAPRRMPYGDFDTMFATVQQQIAQGPYLLGERFTALDTLWGTALAWVSGAKIITPTPEMEAYVQRHLARPAVQRARAADAALAAAFAAKK